MRPSSDVRRRVAARAGDRCEYCRLQHWLDHFRLEGEHLLGVAAEGRTTVEFLRLNSFERITERSELIHAGAYSV